MSSAVTSRVVLDEVDGHLTLDVQELGSLLGQAVGKVRQVASIHLDLEHLRLDHDADVEGLSLLEVVVHLVFLLVAPVAVLHAVHDDLVLPLARVEVQQGGGLRLWPLAQVDAEPIVGVVRDGTLDFNFQALVDTPWYSPGIRHNNRSDDSIHTLGRVVEK